MLVGFDGEQAIGWGGGFEHGLMAGGAVLVVGVGLAVGILVTWFQRGFGELSEARLGILAATLIIVGLQVVFSSFLLSILGLRRRG